MKTEIGPLASASPPPMEKAAPFLSDESYTRPVGQIRALHEQISQVEKEIEALK